MQNRAIAGAGPRRAVVPCAALVLVVLLTGCAATRPDPQAEATAARAAGLEGSITFRVEGGPLDEPAAGDALTRADAVHRAVTTDPDLQAALARVRIAMADADQARLLPNPVLSVVLRWGPGEPQIEASLAQDVIRAMRIPRRSSAADNRLRQAAADAVSVALDVVAEVQERYAGVQALDTLVPLLRQRLVLIGKLADTARARLEAGEGTRMDVVALEAQRVELEVEITATELRRREERIRLARLIGEPSSAAAWALEPWSAPVLVAEPESRWVEAALASRPEVQAVSWRLAALGDEHALARQLAGDGASVGVEAERDGDWFLGPAASAPVPVFDTGQARRARLTAEQVEARHGLTLAKRRVVEEVRVAYEALAAARENLGRIRDELIPLQERRRQLAEDVYAVEGDITPLLLAEQDLRAAEASAIDAERQVAVAVVRLHRAVGGPGVARDMGSTPLDAGPPAPAAWPWQPRIAGTDHSRTATRN